MIACVKNNARWYIQYQGILVIIDMTLKGLNSEILILYDPEEF